MTNNNTQENGMSEFDENVGHLVWLWDAVDKAKDNGDTNRVEMLVEMHARLCDRLLDDGLLGAAAEQAREIKANR